MATISVDIHLSFSSFNLLPQPRRFERMFDDLKPSRLASPTSHHPSDCQSLRSSPLGYRPGILVLNPMGKALPCGASGNHESQQRAAGRENDFRDSENLPPALDACQGLCELSTG
jgi:hypothetical protein